MNTSNSALADYPATMESANNYLHDYDEIIKAMQPYIDGCKTGKSELMHPGFHPDATMVGYAPGQFMFVPVQILYDWIDGNGPAPDIEIHFSSIEILDTIAVVRLEVYGWTGKLIGPKIVHMSDYFNLIKTDEGWKISQKLFRWHTK
jgi:hypothetical protein